MSKLVRSKTFIGFILSAFVLFITPVMDVQAAENTSSLIGFIYAEDGNTPVEGAVFKIKNVKTNEVFSSEKTDELGIFKIEGIAKGMYLAGVKTDDNTYAIQNVLGFQGGETAKLSLALKPGQKFPAPKGIEGHEALSFLGLQGAAAWAALAIIIAALGLTLADLLNLGFADWFLIPEPDEASPFKK